MTALLTFLPDLAGAKHVVSRDPPPSAKIIRPAKIYLEEKNESAQRLDSYDAAFIPIFRLRDECVGACMAARFSSRLN
jgi:hypothetical protein